MRRQMLLVAAVLLALAVVTPARSESALLTFNYCTGDGYFQLYATAHVADVDLHGDVGCYRNGRSHPMDIDTNPALGTIGDAGGCGEDGVVGPLKNLRMPVHMILTYNNKKYSLLRTWMGDSIGDFPGSNIVGQVRDPTGAVKLGQFRLEFYPSFYCTRDLVSIRLWNIVVGPSPGT